MWLARANGAATLCRKLPDQTVSSRVPVVLVCAATLLVGGCSRHSEAPPLITVGHEIFPAPARVGVSTITFKLTDAAGKPITGAKVALEADMSHAGMSPVFADALEAQPGRYQTSVNFQMAGDWILLLHVTLPGGKKLERQIEARGVRPN
jgi:hypothetical protein